MQQQRRVAVAVAVIALGCAPAPETPTATPGVEIPPPDAGAPGSAEPELQGAIRCAVEVMAIGDVIAGEAGAEGQVDPSDEAWRRACAAVRAKHDLDCEDEGQVRHSSRREQLSITNGAVARQVRIELRPVLARLREQGASDQTGEEACRQAIERACRRAPKGSQCDVAALGCEPVGGNRTRWRCGPDVRAREPVDSIFGA